MGDAAPMLDPVGRDLALLEIIEKRGATCDLAMELKSTAEGVACEIYDRVNWVDLRKDYPIAVERAAQMAESIRRVTDRLLRDAKLYNNNRFELTKAIAELDQETEKKSEENSGSDEIS